MGLRYIMGSREGLCSKMPRSIRVELIDRLAKLAEEKSRSVDALGAQAYSHPSLISSAHACKCVSREWAMEGTAGWAAKALFGS